MFVVSEDKPLSEEELTKLREMAKQESINDALRKPKPDEKRVLGRLSKVECGRSGIIYTFKAGTDLFKFRSKDFQGLELMTFTPTGDTPVSCSGVEKEYLAVVTFVPGEDAKTKTSGELFAIELVPDDFRLLEN